MKNHNLTQLSEMYSSKDWFFDVGTDEFNNLVVYTKYICEDNLKNVPDKLNDQHVLVHFASNKMALASKYIDDPTKFKFTPVQFKTIVASLEPKTSLLDEDFESLDVEFLTKELDQLMRVCESANILEDIAYEVHDGDNAVTSLSNKFPSVRKRMENLYQDFGFDILFDSIDELK